jgi:cyclopropane fatty-acyl-phospholipid synthase-like methyltransferase
MSSDPKQIVAAGYDEIAETYLAWSALAPSPQRMQQLHRLLELLPPGTDVLELGCGAGIPVTQALAERGNVIGIDISTEQLMLAERHVPDAQLIHADMVALDFDAETFDAVVAFYALTHVPRDEHAGLLERIAGWLRPGGLLFATLGAHDSPDMVQPDWLGTSMFFSHYDAETNCDMVRRAGFELLDATLVVEEEDDEAVEFLWVTARK